LRYFRALKILPLFATFNINVIPDNGSKIPLGRVRYAEFKCELPPATTVVASKSQSQARIISKNGLFKLQTDSHLSQNFNFGNLQKRAIRQLK